jgi:dynein heavy chain
MVEPPTLESDEEFIFFLKSSQEPITIDNINNVLFYKKVQSNHLKSLLSVMNIHFIPKLVKDGNWPDNVKKEFLAQLHKFMSGVTETCYEMEGYT